MPRKDLTNQVFGRLLVLRYYGHDKNNHTIWTCKCNCGKIINCLASNLTTGKTKSCGCLRKENTIKQNIERSNIQIEQQKFGKLLVLEKIIDNKNIGRNKYKCQCDCGNVTYVLPGDLKSGKVQSCGCSRSKGNQLINKILSNSNYIFKKEYKIIYNDNIYYFDFAIQDEQKQVKCFIEFDGEQHYYYQKNTTGWNTQEHFKKVQHSDNQKNQYCLNNNIPLIRIPYWDYNKVNEKYLKERIDKILC